MDAKQFEQKWKSKASIALQQFDQLRTILCLDRGIQIHRLGTLADLDRMNESLKYIIDFLLKESTYYFATELVPTSMRRS